MATPILTTKLYIPPPRPKVVPRTHLIERLNQGLHHHCKLTLISAPAGFGKTTVVTQWIAECRRLTAWLSLDEGDNDLSRFLTYLVAALQTLPHTSRIGEEVMGILQSSQPLPPEPILTALLNEIATLHDPDHFLLVLDDYHQINAKPVEAALTFLLEHLPPQMHLVITTREDPPLPLARLRARGQLTELRASDLRFTTTEAAGFLQLMGLNLSAQEVASLEERTEGWIAGLQLAALSMQGQSDVAGFIRAFAGDHRYIVDYLVEEVLERQSESVRRFLLQTAILDRLNGTLCNAVTGQEQGQARLETLERGNFFIVPLDNKRQWYRYHHLFAEVLLAHLRAEEPDQVATLHRRASQWYEQHGLATEAIRHALAARDFERAAALIERAVPAMRQSRQEATMLGWLRALPDELFQHRPVLSVHYAEALLLNGQFEGVETRLREAARWVDTTVDESEWPQTPPVETLPEQSRRMVIVNEEEFRRLPGMLALYRAASALILGDVPATLKYARLALDRFPEEDHLGRGSAAAVLGLSYWGSGDLEPAYRAYAEGMAGVQRAGNISDAIGCSIALADIRITQGRLHEAMRIYEHSLQLATQQGTPNLRGTADMYVGMSALYLERNDLDATTQHLHKSQALGELAGLPQNPYRSRVAMARIKQAQGDWDSALELLHEAERVYVGDFFPNVRPISAMKARMWVMQGRLDEAQGWVREQGLSVEDELSYLHEFEHITLARLLIAQSKNRSGRDRNRADRSIDEVIGLLKRLLQAAQAGGRLGSAIEILVLHSLAHQAQGDIPAALVPLQRALTLAELEGYVRVFVDEGFPMTQLLQEAIKHKLASDYIRQLLTTFGKVEDERPVKQALVEPLTERELELLRLLRTNLTGPEIARNLLVSLSTVRTHTQNIYTKLEVSDRRSAVNRGEELGLL